MTTITVAIPSTSQPVGAVVTATDPLEQPSPLKARLWNPKNKNWDSLTRGMDPIDAQVVNALSLYRWAGPTTENEGTRIRDIRKMGPALQDQIRSEVNRALARLRRNRDIRLVGIFFDIESPGDQMLQFRVEYINLRAPKGSTRSVMEATP